MEGMVPQGGCCTGWDTACTGMVSVPAAAMDAWRRERC